MLMLLWLLMCVLIVDWVEYCAYSNCYTTIGLSLELRMLILYEYMAL